MHPSFIYHLPRFDPDFVQLRTAVCEVLQREDELIEAVQTNTLTEDDKVVLETARYGPRVSGFITNNVS